MIRCARRYSARWDRFEQLAMQRVRSWSAAFGGGAGVRARQAMAPTPLALHQSIASASRSMSRPASDDRLAPSKSIVSFFARSAGRSKASGVASVMAVAPDGETWHVVSTPICYDRALRLMIQLGHRQLSHFAMHHLCALSIADLSKCSIASMSNRRIDQA